MKPGGGRDKGNDFERWVARNMTTAWDVPCKRIYGQARQGSDNPDVRAPGLWTECKTGARVFWEDAWNKNETEWHANIGGLAARTQPVVIGRVDRKPELVIFAEGDWCEGWARHSLPTINGAAAALHQDRQAYVIRVGGLLVTPFRTFLECPIVRAYVHAAHERAGEKFLQQIDAHDTSAVRLDS